MWARIRRIRRCSKCCWRISERMNQDEEHLRLLSIFHYVVAGFAALFSCMGLIYLIMGFFMLFHPESFGPPNNRPPAFMGVMFACMGAAIVLFGWTFAACIAYAGRCLSQRKRYTFCIVMVGVACLFMPFGTLLGVFGIIVLIRPSVKALFGVAPSAFAK